MPFAHLPKISFALGALCTAAAAHAQSTPSYAFSGTIAIPVASSNTAGTFTGYDLATFDPSSQLYYLTDRSNNGIDVFSSKDDTFVTRIGPGSFAGVSTGNDTAGPNGISLTDLPGGGKLLIAGDGPSTFKSFDLAPDGITVVGTPSTVSTAVAGTPAPANRVDGVAYAPTTNTVLAANNAADPGFVTLVNHADNTVIRSIKLDGTGGYPNVAGNGVEAAVFNTARKTFFVAVPSFNATGAGGVIELNPANGELLNTFDFNALGLASGCGPTGMAQGNGASLLVGCGDAGTATILLDPTGKGSIKVAPQVSGADQVAFDPKRNTFFEASRFQPGGPVLGIFDGSTGSFMQTLPITAGDHSVAVDPVTGKVFVAFGAGAANAYCTEGCIGVFAPVAAVPEPATTSMLVLGLAGLFGVGRWRKGRRAATSAMLPG